MKVLVWLVVGALSAHPSPGDGGCTPTDALVTAYRAAELKDYSLAAHCFQVAIKEAPTRWDLRKDYAYLLLRMGDTVAAREVFRALVEINPSDEQAALEYAFLCYETGKVQEARKGFRELQLSKDPQVASLAKQAFENVDRPLREGIQRWRQALAADPNDWNAHRELAILAERREDPELASQHFRRAWELRPQHKSLLVDYGRACLQAGRVEEGRAALVAAMWGGEPRAAEAGKKLFGNRYPYVYEFRQAIQLDPNNELLRSELVHLLYAMGLKSEAEKELKELAYYSKQRLSEGLRSATSPAEMARRSYQAGYLKDAIRYGLAAVEENPLDYQSALTLGWSYNLMRRDELALPWFDIARHSSNRLLAMEAEKAYKALKPNLATLRLSSWFLPVYSTRWSNYFAYAQTKLEWRPRGVPGRVYLSTRLVCNWHGLSREIAVQSLSEKAVIPGLGFATIHWKGLMAWGEWGLAKKLQSKGSRAHSAYAKDFRGGLSFSKGAGRLMGSKGSGMFVEAQADALFLTRFERTWLLLTQHRLGYTWKQQAGWDGISAQAYFALNASTDTKKLYWANVTEAGLGVKFHVSGMPQGSFVFIDRVRGFYARRSQEIPGDRWYSDLRVGLWYAFYR